MSEHQQFRDLVDSYAIGALGAEERAAFEAHLATCAECAKALDEARAVVAELAHLAPLAQPSPELRERIFQHVRREAREQEQAPSRARAPWWLWAGAAALLLFSVYSAWDAHRLKIIVDTLNERTAVERQRHEALQKEFLAAQMQARILTDPRSKKIMLPAKDPKMPQLEAMWNPEYGLCLMGSDVPMPSRNRAFQLWLIPKVPGGKPMPMHTMWPDAQGKLMHVFDKPPEAMWDTKAIAVTEEPASGSPQPTSEPMWVGAVG